MCLGVSIAVGGQNDPLWFILTFFIICVLTVYTDIGSQTSDTATLTFAFDGTATNRMWEIKVTQVPCFSSYRSVMNNMITDFIIYPNEIAGNLKDVCNIIQDLPEDLKRLTLPIPPTTIYSNKSKVLVDSDFINLTILNTVIRSAFVKKRGSAVSSTGLALMPILSPLIQKQQIHNWARLALKIT